MGLIRRLILFVSISITASFVYASDSNQYIKSWVEIRDQHVVKQQFDYSCGSSALATLFQFYFGDIITETEIIENISAHLTKQEMNDRIKNGLSILDLKKMAQRKNYLAVGVKLPLTALPQLKGPILVHLKDNQNNHFAVFKGVKEDRIYIADPSLGNIRLSVSKFRRLWDGSALILGKKNGVLMTDYPLKVTDELPIRLELNAARRALYY